jgi:hypothetical protein
LLGAGVPPIWKKEFMTLEGTKSFFQHSTGFVSGRFEDKGQGIHCPTLHFRVSNIVVQNMKRKEHVPNWAMESFTMIISTPTSASSSFLIPLCDSEKREQLLARALQGISWMIATLEPMITIDANSLSNPSTPRDDSSVNYSDPGGSVGKGVPVFVFFPYSFFSLMFLVWTSKRSTKPEQYLEKSSSIETRGQLVDERRFGSNEKRREEKWMNQHREKKEFPGTSIDLDLSVYEVSDGLQSQSYSQRSSGSGWNRQINISTFGPPSNSITLSPRLVSPRGSSQKPKEKVEALGDNEDRCQPPVHALRIANPRWSSQKIDGTVATTSDRADSNVFVTEVGSSVDDLSGVEKENGVNLLCYGVLPNEVANNYIPVFVDETQSFDPLISADATLAHLALASCTSIPETFSATAVPELFLNSTERKVTLSFVCIP